MPRCTTHRGVFWLAREYNLALHDLRELLLILPLVATGGPLFSSLIIM